MSEVFASQGCPGKLPGFGRPINYAPRPEDADYIGPLFPNALTNDVCHLQALTTLREFSMMQWMDDVCSKSDWHVKVNNPEITKKWKEETLAARHPDEFSEAMVDYCLAELQDRAKAITDPANPPPSLVFDAGVYRSETAISPALKKDIQNAVVEFESRIPDKQKDWHPNSGDKVWDLFHPSLFSLVYGETRILPNGDTTTLDDCISRCGQGEVVPVPITDEIIEKTAKAHNSYWSRSSDGVTYSRRFQWLPCDVDISGAQPKIMSYINNLHPVHDKRLYGIIEQVIAAVIPSWELTLSRINPGEEHRLRIACTSAKWDRPKTYETDSDSDEEEGEDEPEERPARQRPPPRKLIYPEPNVYDFTRKPEKLNLKDKFGKRGLQVIVKFANIQLTPEKPNYEGGTWHVEGQLNEHIVSTALYYYSNENITQSKLSFRHQVENEESMIDFGYEQDEHAWLSRYFGCHNEGPGVQEIGSVKTNEGRLLTFPNILQHQVGPFGLADPTKSGHRKIIALFLVDPNIKVVSTANVPCQQREWWWDLLTSQGGNEKQKGLDKLPLELQQHVYDDVDDFPLSMDTAKELRLELMKERTVFVDEQTKAFEGETFSLCEH